MGTDPLGLAGQPPRYLRIAQALAADIAITDVAAARMAVFLNVIIFLP